MNKINPNHTTQSNILRILGPTILLIGLTFFAIGFISFFLALGKFGSPKFFWCAFVGMPIMFVGLVMCKFAFIGKVARYTAGEIAPVGKDTFNYLAEESKEGISDVAEAIAEGMSRNAASGIEERIRRLEGMKESGLINEEDFEQQKDRILSEI